MRERLSQKGVFKLRTKPIIIYPGKEEPRKGREKPPYGHRSQSERTLILTLTLTPNWRKVP